MRTLTAKETKMVVGGTTPEEWLEERGGDDYVDNQYVASDGAYQGPSASSVNGYVVENGWRI